jgi:NAD(P)-dependent dehydrogenase (short-subunit alcohol dehydrogenase family)
MPPQHWKNMIDLNLHVAYSVSHFACPHLAATQGHILNFTYAGVENLTAWPSATAYATAKAGLAILTKSLAQSLAPKGVRVNSISPGWIDFGKFPVEKLQRIEKKIPMGRLGRPNEVVELAEWLLTKSPEYLTGAIISLGGGLEF